MCQGGNAAAQLLQQEMLAGASPSQGQQLVPSMATGSVATMFTMGGVLVGGGGAGRTVIFTTSDTVEAPPLSAALAVSACIPGGGLLQTRRNRSLNATGDSPVVERLVSTGKERR